MRAIVGTILGLLAGGWAGATLQSGSRLYDVAVSPDGRERLEYYTPRRWQRLIAPDTWNQPDFGYVRLTSVETGTTDGDDSGVFWFTDSGPVAWSKTEVRIGQTASFSRAKKRWTLDLH